MVILELSALGIAVAALLLERLDRHRDEIRAKPDVGSALVDLYRVLKGWAVAARDVNAVYNSWVQAGSYGTFDDYDSFQSQAAVVKVFEDLTGSSSPAADRPERPPPAIERLEIYAPELRRELQRLAAVRLETYETVRGLLDNYAENVTELSPDQLEQSAEGLDEAAERLRLFIVENFPAQTL